MTAISIICRFPNYFKSSASWVAGESPTDLSGRNHSFDVGENKIVICHLFEEVRDGKLVIAITHFVLMTSIIARVIDSSQVFTTYFRTTVIFTSDGYCFE